MGLSVFGQTDSTTPPYKRFPTLPPLEILLTDSTTLFGKAQIPANTPVLYMLFDPGCSHCQHETEELVAHKKDFEQIQVVMITMPRSSFAEVNDFINKYCAQVTLLGIQFMWTSDVQEALIRTKHDKTAMQAA
ncbi:MAG: hypothetical protein ACJ75F_10650, partial [Flavisolibacter sp.]